MNRQDNFSYSADPIENGTPSDGGADWAGPATFGANGSIMYRNGGTEKYLECSATDHEVTVKLHTLGSQSGVIARVSGGDYYAWIRSGTGGTTMELYSVPSFSLLGSGGAPSAGDTIYLRCVGTTITAGINGTPSFAPVTNSDHTTGTKAGVHSGDQYDDFTITDLAGGGGGGQPLVKRLGGVRFASGFCQGTSGVTGW